MIQVYQLNHFSTLFQKLQSGHRTTALRIGAAQERAAHQPGAARGFVGQDLGGVRLPKDLSSADLRSRDVGCATSRSLRLTVWMSALGPTRT